MADEGHNETTQKIQVSDALRLRAKIEGKKFLCPYCRGWKRRPPSINRGFLLSCDVCVGTGRLDLDTAIQAAEEMGQDHLIEVIDNG